METSPPLEDVVALLAVVVVVPVMVAVAAALHHLDLDQQGLLKQNVTGFGKTLRMGSARDSRNARF